MQIPNYEERKLALIEEITVAFDGISREGGVSLSEAWVIDDYGDDEERAAARKSDTETRWQDVPEKNIAYSGPAMCFMDAIGFRYYWPAFAVWYLQNVDNRNRQSVSFSSSAINTLPFLLGPNADNRLTFELFTVQQSKVVARWLVLAGDVEERRHIEAWQREKDDVHDPEWHENMLTEGHTTEEIEVFKLEAENSELEMDYKNYSRQALAWCWVQFLAEE